MYAAKKAAGASPYSMRGPSSSGTATPMMSPAPPDSMSAYNIGAGSGNGYDQQQIPYDMGQGYEQNMHQDLSP